LAFDPPTQNSKLKTQNSTPRVSVIIPSHNGAHLLSECLEALWNQTYRDFETIVVDDASTDGTYDLLLGYPEVVKVVALRGSRGHGFVVAANAGLDEARGDILVLLNNDAVPSIDWLKELVGGLDRNPWAGMAASKLLLYDRPGFFHSTGDYYGLDAVPNSRGVWQRDTGQYEREEEVFGACAAAAAYRRSLLVDMASAGGSEPPGEVFDPQLWMYCEDVDLNLRARLRGHRTVYVPTATVRHRLSATGGGRLASYYVGRNLLYLIAKDLPGRTILRNLPRVVLAQSRFALQAARHIREPAARARLRGMLVGLLTWPRVLPSRRRTLHTSRLAARAFEQTLRRFSSMQFRGLRTED
jgi:GT2 family glycosyltransferase